MNSVIEPKSVPDDISIPYQAASLDIWDKKYRLRDLDGRIEDEDIQDTYRRVARSLVTVEVSEDKKRFWYEEFLWALNHGALPAGRIMSNAGAAGYKPSASTINCTVSAAIPDTIEGILQVLKEAGVTLKAGCGIGYEFSTLRPRNANVSGIGSQTSGPVSFMEIFDSMCSTIMSAGGRRGAQMATFDIRHPDVLEFIEAKKENGRLRRFNLSLLISDEFMDAVVNDGIWTLAFPVRREELSGTDADLNDTDTFMWCRYDVPSADYITDVNGLTACRIHNRVPARHIWDKIMRSTYEYSEPGFILADRINEFNNNWFCESIRATNPCGEQPLPAHGACLLGSINLTRFVNEPFTADAGFDMENFRRTVRIFTRMLDNVVELNGLPLQQQRDSIQFTRRHGMGFFGLGSCLTMLGIRYGSADSVALTGEISREMALTGWQYALELSMEKGPAPIMEKEFVIDEMMLQRRPEMREDGYCAGDRVKGSVLHARYSRYMQKIAKLDPQLVNKLEKYGARFTHHTSIAPTGTIALSFGNNASNGIEPSFAHRYCRNIVSEGKKTREQINVYSCEMLAYKHLVNPGLDIHNGDVENDLPEYFISATDITPEEHVDVQAAAQKWIDSSISKTINVPTDYNFDDFKNIYEYAYQNGLKGCTTFRFNPDVFQGVLVKNSELEKMEFTFTLDDGSKITAKGTDEIEYHGETHTAANLYDALKEGCFGKT